MEWISDPNIWIALVTLTVLEVVLGVDNIIFISILVGKLPHEDQTRGRLIGLSLAMIMRVGLLFSLTWVIGLVEPIFTLFGQEISGRDMILILGGLFLLAKSTHEIHSKLEGEEHETATRVAPSFTSVIIQIILLDAVFSLDSVITAVGMVDQIGVMIAAVVIAVGIMMVSAAAISNFVNRHPTIKMLALSFLLLIGVSLLAEGFDQHIPKAYIYFAVAFSIFVELLNLRARSKSRAEPVKLREEPRLEGAQE